MTDAIISRGATSVTIDVIETGDSLAVARDVGKPTATYRDTGTENPRFTDHLNAGDAWTIAGLLHGTNAYSDAQTLVDLVKERATSNTPLQLDLSALPSRGTYDVAPTTGSALTLAYVPGVAEMVGVQLTVNVVAVTLGSTEDPPQTTQSSFSPDAGSGIKLTDGTDSVTLTSDLRVVRKVGRPNGKLNPRPANLPTYLEENDPASDIFEISGTLKGANAESDANTLEESLVRAQRGTTPLELHFQSNLFSLEGYSVVPDGTQALRTVSNSGETGVIEVPKLALRVVWDTDRPSDITQIGANS